MSFLYSDPLPVKQWMPIDEYADQPFVKKNSGFDYVAKVCLAKANNNYTGLSAIPTYSSSGKKTYLYSKLDIWTPNDTFL